MLGVLSLLAAGAQGRGTSGQGDWGNYSLATPVLLTTSTGPAPTASLAQTRRAPGAKFAGPLMLILRFPHRDSASL